MRKLSELDQSIHTQMLIMEHFLVYMLENINMARHYLNHNNRNTAISTLLQCAEGYEQLEALYRSIIAQHRNADLIERED